MGFPNTFNIQSHNGPQGLNSDRNPKKQISKSYSHARENYNSASYLQDQLQSQYLSPPSSIWKYSNFDIQQTRPSYNYPTNSNISPGRGSYADKPSFSSMDYSRDGSYNSNNRVSFSTLNPTGIKPFRPIYAEYREARFNQGISLQEEKELEMKRKLKQSYNSNQIIQHKKDILNTSLDKKL